MPYYHDERPQRKNHRKEETDYRQNGAFFLTICIKERHEILGRIQAGKMVLSEIGEQVKEITLNIEKAYSTIILDSFVVMPNHVHLLLLFVGGSKNPSTSRVIQQWKGIATKKIGFPAWQEGYYDNILFTAEEYRRAKEYIQTNVKRWEHDQFNPKSANQQEANP